MIKCESNPKLENCAQPGGVADALLNQVVEIVVFDDGAGERLVAGVAAHTFLLIAI